MTLNRTISPARIIQLYEGSAKKVVEKVTDEMFLDIRQFSPVRTGRYLWGHRNRGVRVEGKLVIWEVVNEWAYPEKVEEGWRRVPVNWHLLNQSIYRSRGANTYKRALEVARHRLITGLQWL